MSKTIYHYELRYYEQPTKFYNHDKFDITKLSPLAENDKYIVFNDLHFTKIEKSGDGVCYSTLNKPKVYFRDCLGCKGVFYTLYSDVKTRISTVEKQIRAKAEEEYGYLFSKGLKLSILRMGKDTDHD